MSATDPVRTTSAKLRLAAGDAVLAPDPLAVELVGALPPGATVVDVADGADAALLVCRSAAELDAVLASHGEALRRIRAPWVLYRKGGRSDLNRDSIWRRVEQDGFALVGNIAIDDEWSSVRLKDART